MRRVYFGEKESASSRSDREQSHEEDMDNLQREIAEIEERLRLRRLPDSDRPVPPIPRDDDNDDPPPSFAHTNEIPDATSGVLVAHVAVQEIPSPSNRATGSIADPPSRGPTLAHVPGIVESSPLIRPIRKLVFLSKRILHRIMAAKESLFLIRNFRAEERPRSGIVARGCPVESGT